MKGILQKPKKRLWVLRVILIILIIVVSVFIVRRVLKNNKSSNFYPDTVDAPVLELKWDGEFNPKNITRITPYGVWEGWFDYNQGTAYEPANEMQFYMKTDVEKYLAVAPGIVVQNEIHNSNVGLVTVRYGKNFAVNYCHIIPDEKLEIGQKIEAGDLLGKMEKRINPQYGEETWWEIQIVEYKNPYIRTTAPYQYFSENSQKILDEAAKNPKEQNSFWETKPGGDAWTITEGCSWLKYAPNWWSSFDRLGYVPDGAIDQKEEDFINSINTDWKVSDNQGRIIGPDDKCKY